jgi:integrase/recombinase XerD
VLARASPTGVQQVRNSAPRFPADSNPLERTTRNRTRVLKCQHARTFSRYGGDAPDKNRTCARGLGNRCYPNRDSKKVVTNDYNLPVEVRELSPLLDAYWARLGRDNAAAGTRTKYRQHVGAFLTWLGDRDPAAVQRAIVEEYLDAWYAKSSPAPATVAARIAALKSFYRYLEDRELLVTPEGHELRNPVEKIKAPRRRRKSNDWLGDDEDKALLSAKTTEQERIVVWLLRWSGLRVSEACGLLISDVDLKREELRVRESKSDSGQRSVPIVPELHVELRAWIDHLKRIDRYRANGPLLVTSNGTHMKTQFAWRLVKRVAHRAGVRVNGDGDLATSISPHTLRRTFGSHLLNHGVRLESVSKLLGHADTRVTEASYAEMLDETVRVEVLRAVS